MGSYEEESIFIESVDALEYVLEMQFTYFGYVLFLAGDFEVLLRDGVDFILGHRCALGCRFFPFFVDGHIFLEA